MDHINNPDNSSANAAPVHCIISGCLARRRTTCPTETHGQESQSQWNVLFVRGGTANAARVLDRFGIKYELREYDVDPDDLSAETVAAKIGLPAEQVFKTLAVHGDRNGVCLAVISANQELNVKALANQRGDRKIAIVSLKEVQALTGYIRGGVTALAARRITRCISTSLRKSAT